MSSDNKSSETSAWFVIGDTAKKLGLTPVQAVLLISVFTLASNGGSRITGLFSSQTDHLIEIREEFRDTTDELRHDLDSLRLELDRRYATQVEVSALEAEVRALQLDVQRILVTSGLDE